MSYAPILTDAPKLSPEDVERIVGFLGYGNLNADVWFVGKEEGIAGKSDEDALYNLKARTQFEETMDLYEAHLLLHKDRQPIDITVDIPNTSVWRYQSKMMLHRRGDPSWSDRTTYRRYISRELGRKTSQTFMTELEPVPSKSSSDRRFRDHLAACHSDFEKKIQERRERLKSLSAKPKLIVCYSLAKRNEFASLLGIEWIEYSDEIFTTRDERCVLVPFLGVGQLRKEVFYRLIQSKLLGSSMTV